MHTSYETLKEAQDAARKEWKKSPWSRYWFIFENEGQFTPTWSHELRYSSALLRGDIVCEAETTRDTFGEWQDRKQKHDSEMLNLIGWSEEFIARLSDDSEDEQS